MNPLSSHSRNVIPALVLLCLSSLLSAAPATDAPPNMPKYRLPVSLVPELPPGLSDTDMKKLTETGYLAFTYGAVPQTRLFPRAIRTADAKAGAAGQADQNRAAAVRRMTTDQAAIRPTMGIESLWILPVPPALAANPNQELAIYNILHSFRSMEGIEYYSRSRERMRIFYTKSHLVESPASAKAIPDPVFSSIGPASTYTLEQEDSSFGLNRYSLTVIPLEGGGFSVRMKNLTKMWYGIIPVLDPESLLMYMTVQVSSDGGWLLFYGNAVFQAVDAFGSAEKAQSSFLSRLSALAAWFAARAAH